MASNAGIEARLKELQKYSACDVSDALLKLQNPAAGRVPRAGHLADIVPFALGSVSTHQPEDHEKVIAPARTLKLVAKTSDVESLPADDPHAVPSGKHWVDMTETNTVMVIEQPEGQGCAAIGGIMAQKMKVNGVAACVVGGRVRDIEELKASELPVFAIGKSTVGTGAESKVHSRNKPISIKGVQVAAGDIVFCDPVEGIVVIPQDLLDQTLELIPKLVPADEKVKKAVLDGMPVADAFKKFRG